MGFSIDEAAREFAVQVGLELRRRDDEAGLLGAALAAGPRKVVVKRPPKGPWLAGARPSYALTGKAVRYDVLVPPR